MTEPKLVGGGPARWWSRLGPLHVWLLGAGAAVLGVLAFAWVFGGPRHSEPLRPGFVVAAPADMPMPVAREQHLVAPPSAKTEAFPSPQPSAVARESEERHYKEGAPKEKPAARAAAAATPEPAADSSGQEPARAPSPARGLLHAMAPMGSEVLSGAQPGAGGAALPASSAGGEVQPRQSAPAPSKPAEDSAAARLRRGFQAIGRMIGVSRHVPFDEVAAKSAAVPKTTTQAATSGTTEAPGSPIAGAGAASLPLDAYSTARPSGVLPPAREGYSGTSEPESKSVNGAGGVTPGGGSSSAFTKGDATAFQTRINQRAQAVRSIVAGSAGRPDKVMSVYKGQVAKAAQAVDTIPDENPTLAFFAPAGRYPDAPVHEEVEKFQLFIVKTPTGAAQAQAPSPSSSALSGQDIGLKTRLHDTLGLIGSMDGCLAQFASRAASKPMTAADGACVDTAEKALARRAQPVTGFIPVAKSAAAVLNGEDTGDKSKRLPQRYAELKKRGEKDPAAREAAQKLHEALHAADHGVKGVLAAFKEAPFKPGDQDAGAQGDSKTGAADLRKIASDLALLRLPADLAAAELPRELASAAGGLDDAALGLGQGMTSGEGGKGKKINAVSQFALAVQAASDALLQLQQAQGSIAQLYQDAPDGPAHQQGSGTAGSGGGGTVAGNLGISLMGVQSAHFNCDAALAAFGDGPIRFGYLETSFGSSRECLNRLFASPNFQAVRVHLWNGPCVRNGSCDSSEVLHGETEASLNAKLKANNKALVDKLTNDAQRVHDYLATQLRSGSQCYVSGILEHDLSGEAAKNLTALLKPIFSGLCTLDNSPDGAGARGVGAPVEEWHTATPGVHGRCIVDSDGNEWAENPAFSVQYASCDLALMWDGYSNCCGPNECSRGRPYPRTRAHCPTKTTLAAMAKALRNSSGSGACDKTDKFGGAGARGNLWKPEGENFKDESVAMLKPNYLHTAQTILISDAESGKVLSSLVCDFERKMPEWRCGVFSEDNSGRPFFRPKKVRPGKPVIVRIILKDGTSVCFDNVKDPAKRYD
ncbi:MAG: hypothetical protein NTX64_14030 [Elusimicrobia bacterium]|nr:hypothetical protein [Elusimicrobiota bacterium]